MVAGQRETRRLLHHPKYKDKQKKRKYTCAYDGSFVVLNYPHCPMYDKIRAPAQLTSGFRPAGPERGQASEAVAQTQSCIAPDGAEGVEVVARHPVDGDVHRDRGNLEFETQLGYDAREELQGAGIAVIVVVESQGSTRAYIEVDDAGAGEDEIIGAGQAEAETMAPGGAQVKLGEVVAQTLLIREFCAVSTDTDTQCARLRGSDGGKSEHADENSDNFLHD